MSTDSCFWRSTRDGEGCECGSAALDDLGMVDTRAVLATSWGPAWFGRCFSSVSSEDGGTGWEGSAELLLRVRVRESRTCAK